MTSSTERQPKVGAPARISAGRVGRPHGLDGGFHGEPDSPGGPPAPLVVLYAHDLEALEAKVRAAGAAIVVPIFEFPGGRRFHFQDPAGNVLAVWTAAEG